MTKACIVGWAHTPFGKLDDPDVESLIARVSGEALTHAGIGHDQVDGIYAGVMNNGFSKQGFEAAQVALGHPDLAYVPATHVENACATGSALYTALDFIESGRGRVALVVGAEKMTAKSVAETSDILLSASYRKEEGDIMGGFAGVFGRIAQNYFQRYGDRSEELARIAAKNHRNGVGNPYAQMRRDFGFEFCNAVSEKNPYVAAPLRRTDCSLISDGAAALVVADEETRRRCSVPLPSARPFTSMISCRFPDAIRSRSKARDAPGVKPGKAPASPWTISILSRRTTASPSPS
jgi:acetyl-CoA C-acetyltransferase